MIEHDNNTVYFFPNKKAAKIFSIRNKEMFMYPDGLCRTYRDYNGGVYFSFHLTYHNCMEQEICKGKAPEYISLHRAT